MNTKSVELRVLYESLTSEQQSRIEEIIATLTAELRGALLRFALNKNIYDINKTQFSLLLPNSTTGYLKVTNNLSKEKNEQLVKKEYYEVLNSYENAQKICGFKNE